MLICCDAFVTKYFHCNNIIIRFLFSNFAQFYFYFNASFKRSHCSLKCWAVIVIQTCSNYWLIFFFKLWITLNTEKIIFFWRWVNVYFRLWWHQIVGSFFNFISVKTNFFASELLLWSVNNVKQLINYTSNKELPLTTFFP